MPGLSRVELLDSTLRDGAQGEGISFSVADKLGIVEALDELGVDLIEAGNPGSNPKDAEFFRKASGLRLRRSRLAAFGSTRRKGCRPADDAQLASLLDAGTETVVIFGKSWTFHAQTVLGATLDENAAMIAETVAYLRAEGRRVIFDAEHFFDGYKADPAYAIRCLKAALEGGAEALVLCDTNGGSMPTRIAAGVRAALDAAEGAAAGVTAATIGIHCHNDSGLAVANSLAAVEAGASHVQGTLVGFGERCGNANLSTIAADLRFKYGLDCLEPDSMAGLSKAVRRVAGIANHVIDEGMPYVGLRAFAHKAGMHIDAVHKSPLSFEHVGPDSVGNARRFLASEVGGRSVVMDRIRSFVPGATKGDPAVGAALARLKDMESSGYQYEGAEASLDLLLRKSAGGYAPFFELIRYRTTGERTKASEVGADAFSGSHAMVQLQVGGETEIQAAEGSGPVHALDMALRKALARFYPSLSSMRLTDFKVRVLDGSAATAAKVRVLIESADDEGAWTTVGVSSDVIEASWIALVDSIEYKLYRDGAEAVPAPSAREEPAAAAV